MEHKLKHYRIVGADGSVQYRTVPADALPPRWEKGAERPIQVPRLPDDFEDWDKGQGCYITNLAARADAEAGPAAIARAHAQKAIEALLIDGGLPIEGMLAAEARATGVPLKELVSRVLEKSRAAVLEEVARRVAKTS